MSKINEPGNMEKWIHHHYKPESGIYLVISCFIYSKGLGYFFGYNYLQVQHDECNILKSKFIFNILIKCILYPQLQTEYWSRKSDLLDLKKCHLFFSFANDFEQ